MQHNATHKKFLTLLITTVILSTSFVKVTDSVGISNLIFLSTTSSLTSENNLANQTALNLTRLTHYDESYGAMTDIVVQNNLAFVTAHWGGLYIFDINDLSNPVLIGSFQEPYNHYSYSTNYQSSGVFIRGNEAFVADGDNGLLILNISDLTNPQKIAHYSLTSYWDTYLDVFVEGDFAYVRSSMRKIVVFNISLITQPTLISEFELLGIDDLLVQNNFVYVIRNTQCLVINSTNPYDLRIVSTLNNTVECTLQNNYLITINTSKYLKIYNLSTLQNLTAIASCNTMLQGTLFDICANNKYAFIGSSEEIVKIDITDIEQPQVVLKIQNIESPLNPGESGSIWRSRKFTTFNDASKDEILLYVDYQEGIYIHDFSVTQEDTLIYHFDAGTRIESIVAKDNYLFAASRVEFPYYPSKLEVFALHDYNLNLVSSYYSSGNIQDIEIMSDYLFLSAGNGLEIIDIKNPENPKLITTYEIRAQDSFIDEKLDRLYVSAGWNGFYILDVSDILNPIILGHLSDWAYSTVSIYQDIAFSVTFDWMSSAISAINISDPRNPNVISYLSSGYSVRYAKVYDNFLFLTSHNPDLSIFDISNITSPVSIGSFDDDLLSPEHFQVSNGICFLVDPFCFTVINVSSVSNPYKLLSFKPPPMGFFKDVFVDEQLIFLASAWGGIEIWRMNVTSHTISFVEQLFYTTLTVLGLSMIMIVIIIIIRFKKTN